MRDIPDLPAVRTAAPEEVLRAALARLALGSRVVLATVLARKGSTPSTPGQKLALLAPDEAIGTVGGGAVERKVIESMQRLLEQERPEPRVDSYQLGPSLGMCCGGAVQVMIETMDPAIDVLVVGAGHIGAALAPLLVTLGFRVTVTDVRPHALAAAGLCEGPRLCLVAGDYDEASLAERDVSGAAMLVMTHDHQLDQQAVEWALLRGFGFVGGVGSRAKAARTRERLGHKGLGEADIARVRMPLGLDIGARTPAEIAVSIAGELIGWRAQKSGTARRSGKDAG